LNSSIVSNKNTSQIVSQRVRTTNTNRTQNKIVQQTHTTRPIRMFTVLCLAEKYTQCYCLKAVSCKQNYGAHRSYPKSDHRQIPRGSTPQRPTIATQCMASFASRAWSSMCLASWVSSEKSRSTSAFSGRVLHTGGAARI